MKKYVTLYIWKVTCDMRQQLIIQKFFWSIFTESFFCKFIWKVFSGKFFSEVLRIVFSFFRKSENSTSNFQSNILTFLHSSLLLCKVTLLHTYFSSKHWLPNVKLTRRQYVPNQSKNIVTGLPSSWLTWLTLLIHVWQDLKGWHDLKGWYYWHDWHNLHG